LKKPYRPIFSPFLHLGCKTLTSTALAAKMALLAAGWKWIIIREEQIVSGLEYLPLDTAAMRHAAELWAPSRQYGIPTAHEHALDGDSI
jgi:hypothetical protein